MDPLVLTSVITASAAIIGGPAFATYITKRKTPSVTSVALMLQQERDRLQLKLDEQDRQIAQLKLENERAIIRVESKWQKQHEADQAQIDELYRRLYRVAPPPTVA